MHMLLRDEKRKRVEESKEEREEENERRMRRKRVRRKKRRKLCETYDICEKESRLTKLISKVTIFKKSRFIKKSWSPLAKRSPP
jgi:hypothetical protein